MKIDLLTLVMKNSELDLMVKKHKRELERRLRDYEHLMLLQKT